MIEESQQSAGLTEDESRFIQRFRNLAESEKLILVKRIEEYSINNYQGEEYEQKTKRPYR